MEKLRECPSCGSIPDLLEYGESSITIACGCGFNCGDWTYEDEADCIKSWNTRHEPKHETVEQWEARTGETYPDDGPVWLWSDKYGWMLKQFKRVVLRRPFVRSLGVYMPMLDKKKAIIANHHGKPNSIGGRDDEERRS
jgi:hypothetical protein